MSYTISLNPKNLLKKFQQKCQTSQTEEEHLFFIMPSVITCDIPHLKFPKWKTSLQVFTTLVKSMFLLPAELLLIQRATAIKVKTSELATHFECA